MHKSLFLCMGGVKFGVFFRDFDKIGVFLFVAGVSEIGNEMNNVGAQW